MAQSNSLEQYVERLARLGKRERAANHLGRRDRRNGDADTARALLLALAFVRSLVRVEAPLYEVAL